ncbi:MAG: hypothetical protein AAF465_07935 [Pseudomonadota bacterium]
MLNYQNQCSALTLAEGLKEFESAFQAVGVPRDAGEVARQFFRYHDIVHVVFGAGVSLEDELVVKMVSLMGTTEGWRVLKGYRSDEAKSLYSVLPASQVVRAVLCSVPLTLSAAWRCWRMKQKWPWRDHEVYLTMSLDVIRRQFGIRVVRGN